MNQHWIKVEKVTPDKRAMRIIARTCGVDQDRAFGAWFRLWAWFDGETADGWLPGTIPEDCDDVARLPGISAALVEVGWLEFDQDGCKVAGWDKHNGASAKRRAEESERKRLARLQGKS